MRLQVQQLDKETRERNERLRITAKRMDHIERAFRKEERPLLIKDYEQQQIDDRVSFEAAQKARLQAARDNHKSDVDAKHRLARMLGDYTVRKEELLGRRGEEFAKRREVARQKVEEEKSMRREAILKAREDERKRIEEEEHLQREEEDRIHREEEGQCSELSVSLTYTNCHSRTSCRGTSNRGRGGDEASGRGEEDTREGGRLGRTAKTA